MVMATAMDRVKTKKPKRKKDKNIVNNIKYKLKETISQNKEMIIRQVGLLFLDFMIIQVSMIGSLWVRCDMRFSEIDPRFIESLFKYWWINIACTLLIFAMCHMYTSLWRFASVVELSYIVFSVVVSAIVQTIGMNYMNLDVPRSYPFLYAFILLVLITGFRFSYRFGRITVHNMLGNINYIGKKKKRVMVVGAGAAGYMIVREMVNSKHLHKKVVCVVDDDPAKVGTYLQGIKVVGKRTEIPRFVDKYKIDEIVIAIPTLKKEAKNDLLNICNSTACHVMTLPGIYQLVNEEVSVSMLREVEIEDLLGREPVKMDLEDVRHFIKNRTVLVTGGGGSIGSELCRQIVEYYPKRLIIMDIAENSVYDLQQELKQSHPYFKPDVLIGSVRNKERVDSIFETYHPDIVFHAAAHKHVPLMEDSPNEAIKNNVLGTWNIAEACNKFGTKKMVLISTDKAVRPTNVMGASKRICELIVQAFAQNSRTEYAAVRFGNVLGSDGSVIPLFKKQIAAGGPVTVTHPDIIRYFMTIPEAVNLVLQCGTLARGREVFILDMGEPVKILDLARKMIRLSGLKPGEDIEIIFTGLRPGEKLYEELLINEANLKKTAKERIFVARQNIVDGPKLCTDIQNLINAAFAEDRDIRTKIQKLVPEYVMKEENN